MAAGRDVQSVVVWWRTASRWRVCGCVVLAPCAADQCWSERSVEASQHVSMQRRATLNQFLWACS
jgi:hypothetical protein